MSEKRLRIGGRFVTKQKAFEILGITQSDLLSCPYMQELLNKECAQGKQLASSIKNDKRGGLTHRVYNFQALIDNSYSVMGEMPEKRGKSVDSPRQFSKPKEKESEILSLHLDEMN